MRHARERVTWLRQWLTRQVCWPNRECHLHIVKNAMRMPCLTDSDLFRSAVGLR